MIIDCISDLHGHYPKLEGGDLLIVAGDLTARDERYQYEDFFRWIQPLKYKKKILIAGNHDNQLKYLYKIPEEETDLDYLCDSGIEFEGLKIWGSPWTKSFPGMNPHCKAFTVNTEEELASKFSLIPDDTDILITHSPPHGCYLDQNRQGDMLGSISLRDKIYKMKLKLHCCGHIHEGYGMHTNTVNASHVNEHYQPVNKPIRVIL